MKEFAEGFVEAAHAAESRCDGDLRHGHRGFVDQLLGEEHSAGLGDGEGRRAEVLKEESAKLAFAEAEALCELLYGGFVAVECAGVDQRQRARDGRGGASPRGEMGSRFRAAAEAWAESCFLCCGGRAEEPAVLKLRRARRADGPAIDAG